MTRYAFIVLLALPVLTRAAPPVALNDDEEIRMIEQLDGQVDQLIAKVRQCAAAGLAPASECHCYYPGKLKSARRAYRQVLSRHPEWEDRAILWWYSGDQGPSNLHMGGLKNQIGRPCT